MRIVNVKISRFIGVEVLRVLRILRVRYSYGVGH